MTASEASINFSPAYDLIKSLGGPDLSQNFGYRGKFAFVVQKGYPSKGLSVQAVAGGPKINLNVTVTGNLNI